jgi:ketosteroid isomerase-like protein
METTLDQTTDQAAIAKLVEAWARAMRAKDAAGVAACLSSDGVAYTLAPPLRAPGDGGGGLSAWFATWDGPLAYEIRDLEVIAGGDVAYSHSLNHLGGLKVTGERPDLWFRVTLGFRKIAGAWKIAHEHESVPFYMDGSLRAAVDLAP